MRSHICCSAKRDPVDILGIVAPICFVAWRLMMNSNLIGCSKGILAGLMPLRCCLLR